MNYTEALQYINEIPWTMRKPGLDRIEKLLNKLGRPDRKLKYVHVAGTNGKGSVCAMLASVFIEAGFNTGLFTSPHLMKYNERMKVNGTDITDRELAKCITTVAKAADEMKEEADSINADYESPSEFEILTAAGLLWFKKKKCDIVVLEVGLGGEFDSTNVIENKELAIITPLGYEHTAILGNTIEEIATAKAGIISEGSHVVLAARKMKDNGKDAVKIEKTVAKICKEKNAVLHIPDIKDIRKIKEDLSGQEFISAYYKAPMKLSLIGEYQLRNVLTVLEAVKVLNDNHRVKTGKKLILASHVKKGLLKVCWPARFEVLNRQPVFILDGAHNPHGIEAAVTSLKSFFGKKKIIYIVGMLGDKNVDLMLKYLYSNAKSFITLTPGSDRALESDKLAEKIRRDGFEAASYTDVRAAVKYAFELCDKEKNTDTPPVICSLGSLYLAGEVRSCFTSFNT
ncbi:MAG: bifunctional folylpolyglutamate synthase/dihydrofolate synthase [Lachnospiraceae bacterium]|nr:bifunctional folylpolyglutamate synthase/dihydrofolate synthase [Lachnospiraceae bacterium]